MNSKNSQTVDQIFIKKLIRQFTIYISNEVCLSLDLVLVRSMSSVSVPSWVNVMKSYKVNFNRTKVFFSNLWIFCFFFRCNLAANVYVTKYAIPSGVDTCTSFRGIANTSHGPVFLTLCKLLKKNLIENSETKGICDSQNGSRILSSVISWNLTRESFISYNIVF